MSETGDVQVLCGMCKKKLAGCRYVAHDAKPYCIPCYEDYFANRCDACQKVIGTDSKVRYSCGSGTC